jgi:hypothetical protein
VTTGLTPESIEEASDALNDEVIRCEILYMEICVSYNENQDVRMNL